MRGLLLPITSGSLLRYLLPGVPSCRPRARVRRVRMVEFDCAATMRQIAYDIPAEDKFWLFYCEARIKEVSVARNQ